ncbi:MAG: bacteriophage abortive infection AbiH family protein [Bacteroidaceae bacterium]|nr:bacteriophage abortive infection AbiH family protein [Bacteroidaceae bacterium]
MSNNIQPPSPNFLIIIGNGFDRYHGLSTTYTDFHDWLVRRGKDEFIHNMEEIFDYKDSSGRFSLWHDFETALGKYDLNHLYTLRHTPNPDAIGPEVEQEAEDTMQPTIGAIKPLMTEWIRTVDLSDIQQKLPLPNNALYLTFNYTMTLEKVYGIPNNQILHIHQSVYDQEVIVGCNRTENRWDLEKEHYSDDEEHYKKGLVDVMNQLYKNGRLDSDKEFYEGLKKVEHIFVVGHSLSIIDLRYFGEISLNAPSAHWYISIYSKSDKMRFEEFKNRMAAVPEDHWHTFTLNQTVFL